MMIERRAPRRLYYRIVNTRFTNNVTITYHIVVSATQKWLNLYDPVKGYGRHWFAFSYH